jgi:signal transduction histidine kinase
MSNILQSAQWRFALLLACLVVVGLSIFFTLNLAEDLKNSERGKMQMWAKAQESMMMGDPNCDFTFQSQVIESNKSIPMILVDGDYRIQDARNYRDSFPKNKAFFEKELEELRATSTPIVIEPQSLDIPIKLMIFYRESKLISYLEWFPYVQFGLLFVFLFLTYLSFSSMRKAQQERIWVGMAKETAHQLGTPLTSLVGWIENIRMMYEEDEEMLMMTEEMHKDIELLEIVAGRFSKIGAIPELKTTNIYQRVERHYDYIKQRAPRKVELDFPDFENCNPLFVEINDLLFDWVIENLLKNALDAMGGKGLIRVMVSEDEKAIFIDVSDSGKGMPKKLFRKVFKPGFSTKKRGWGLGLSLCKRIVEQYHNGKIFVKQSIINKGTTFRIQLPKSKT